MPPARPPPGLGNAPIGVDRGDHAVLYVPLPEPYRYAWRSPGLEQRAGEYRHAGANLAANVFELMRSGEFRERTARSPYPRLRTLLTALDGTATVADRGRYRFTDPAGRELRLADVP